MTGDPIRPGVDKGPLPETVEFVRNARTGTVHVIGNTEPGDASVGAAMVRFVLGATVARCGYVVHRHRGGVENGGYEVSHFADDDLCHSCYYSVQEGERPRLFEHP